MFVAKSIEVPTPCRERQRSMVPMPVENAPASAVSPESHMPERKTRRLPRRSATRPSGSRQTTFASR